MTATKENNPAPVKKPNSKKSWALFDKNNKQHMYVMSLCRQLGWTCEHPRWGEVADLSALNTWLRSDKCPVNKPLLNMTVAELQKVVSALEIMNKKRYK